MAESIRTGPNRYPALLVQAAGARNITSRGQRDQAESANCRMTAISTVTPVDTAWSLPGDRRARCTTSSTIQRAEG